MVKLFGERIFLSVLERSHCKTLFEEFEYDFETKTEQLNMGLSIEKSDEWFDDIQKKQGTIHLRLGIFLHNGEVIGDIALQDIDWKNRSADLGMGFAKLANRGKGYGKEAINLLLDHAFFNLGLERISANTLEHNLAAQKSLEQLGFVLEGRQRKAVYFAGKKYDKLNYALLAEEYRK